MAAGRGEGSQGLEPGEGLPFTSSIVSLTLGHACRRWGEVQM